LTWVAGYTKMVYPQTVTHPSINRVRRWVTTSLVHTLPLAISWQLALRSFYNPRLFVFRPWPRASAAAGPEHDTDAVFDVSIQFAALFD